MSIAITLKTTAYQGQLTRDLLLSKVVVKHIAGPASLAEGVVFRLF
jgi:hypothetical protein